MANTITSANMNLNVPVVGVDPGPQYALDVNNCLTLIDQHDHSAGKGVQISPAGLNINSDLPFNNNNLITARSVRFQSQLTPISGVADLGALYESGIDLYYNDGNGTQIRITQSGGIAGTPGSIANLAPPASASYVSANQTFVFQSDANTPANVDGASYVFRNLVANSKGLTLQPPSSMGVDYAITLPALPLTTLPLLLDNTGVMGAGQISTPGIANGAVTNVQIANQTVIQSNLALRPTGTTVSAGGIGLSNSCGVSTVSSTTPVPITNLSVTITTTGRPVELRLIDDGSGSTSGISFTNSNQSIFGAFFSGASQLTTIGFASANSNATNGLILPASSYNHLDFPTAGTYTYSFAMYSSAGTGFSCNFAKLVAYEI